MARRPWRSRGPDVIGRRDFWAQVPTVVARLVEHVARIGPYYVLSRSFTSPASLPPPPSTPWTAQAGRILGEHQMTPPWRAHSERTWHFAAALAAQRHPDLDLDLDLEELYVASLLHDVGFFAATRPGRSFALAGAELARNSVAAVGVDPRRGARVAAAISSHISVKPGNELGKLVHFGSLLDLTATGIWRLERGLVGRVYEAEPRTGFPDDFRTRWLAECARLPLGRAAYAKRPGGLLLASRISPLPS